MLAAARAPKAPNKAATCWQNYNAGTMRARKLQILMYPWTDNWVVVVHSLTCTTGKIRRNEWILNRKRHELESWFFQRPFRVSCCICIYTEVRAYFVRIYREWPTLPISWSVVSLSSRALIPEYDVLSCWCKDGIFFP